jgi:hypothetical protein
MTAPRHADTYFARALELEECARRIEDHGPSLNLAPRWRGAGFLRREAAWWRAYAQDLVETAIK